MGFSCLKARVTLRMHFTFYHYVPRISWYSFYRPQKDEKLSRPWSHPVVLNMGSPGLGIQHLNHYPIAPTTEITNKWFETHLRYRQQYVSINGYNSECASMLIGVPQGSVLGRLLFPLYSNDLNLAIKHCKVRYFTVADDTNLYIY